MKPAASLVILIAGAGASLATLFTCFFLLPWNVMFFTMSYVIPLGAIGAGFVAGLPYYASARLVSYRPGYALTAIMMSLAAAGLIGMFYVFFLKLNMDTKGGTFFDFLHHYLTHVQMKRAGSSSSGTELGVFGYGLFALQIVGFIAPFAAYTAILRLHSFCLPCDKFYKKIGRITKNFEDGEAMNVFLGKLAALPPFSYEYGDALAAAQEPVKVRSGSIQLYYTLYQCPGCKVEILTADAAVKESGNWSTIRGTKRMDPVPPGSTLLGAFGKQT